MTLPSTGLRRPGWSRWAPIAAIAFALGPGAGAALGATGGSSAPRNPEIKDLVCVEGCAGIERVTVGGLFQVTGRHLTHVTRLVFTGGATAPVAVKSSRLLEVRVPAAARSGSVIVEDDFGGRSRRSKGKLDIQKALLRGQSSDGPVIQAAESASRRFYYGARRRGVFRYMVSSEAPVGTRVDVIRQQDGAVVRTFIEQGVQPFALRVVKWDGTNAAGEVEREGRYTFKLHVVDSSGASASRTGPADGTDGISFFRHVFPIRGPHTYGDGMGAGRDHKGQDVFARCGTPLTAARGGVVKWKAYHGRAGYYLVIDGLGTDVDYAYMHLQRPSHLRKGDRVFTGQRIGSVGDSGNASGCHLHFEMWSGGWYDGGSPMDPTPELKAWDAHS